MNRAQIKQFKLLYARRDNKELAQWFQITESEVRALAKRFALGKDKHTFEGLPMPRWEEEEEVRLREMFAETPNLEIALRLGRSVKAVTSKANKLGLKKTPEHRRKMVIQNVNRRHHPEAEQ